MRQACLGCKVLRETLICVCPPVYVYQRHVFECVCACMCPSVLTPWHLCVFLPSPGKRGTAYEEGEQTLYVKVTHIHPRYIEGRPDNDLAVVELRDRMVFKKTVVAACLPERDFADSVLMSGVLPAVVTGFQEPKENLEELQGPLTVNQLAYEALPACVERHGELVTNKMGCTAPRVQADCKMGSGSALLTLHREVFFLTGVVSRPPGGHCAKGYLYQRVSRYMPWLQSLMDSR